MCVAQGLGPTLVTLEQPLGHTSSLVIPAQSWLLYQPQRLKFVDVGEGAHISCPFGEDTIRGGLQNFFWFKRAEDETMLSVVDCSDKKTNDKFVCKIVEQDVVLEIMDAQVEDSGFYLCAERCVALSYCLYFQESSLVVVGDSYTPSTWVTLLHPALQDPPSPPSPNGSQVACVAHGASNFVRLSWDTPGNPQHSGQTLLVRNSSGSLTFVSLLLLPAGLSHREGNITCVVTFNSSGTNVTESILYTEEPEQPFSAEGTCSEYVVPMAVLGVLVLLLALLTVLWVRFGPSRPGLQPKVPEVAPSEMAQGEICYSQLRFLPKKKKRKERRRASPGTLESPHVASGQMGVQL